MLTFVWILLNSVLHLSGYVEVEMIRVTLGEIATAHINRIHLEPA